MTEETLFERAVQLPVADRAAFLDRECADRPDLRARVEALLAADAQSQLQLEIRSIGQTVTVGDPGALADRNEGTTADRSVRDAHAGTVIAGRYTLVEPIGEGGMGSVWRAKQTEPVKRSVAVKLIKAGMDSKQVLTRFEAERQALALMNHPNIAKVLDGGLHDHRPYFVMELVTGVPITAYCDQCRLTPPKRLELFIQACQAIQHAHQKGIIHRDIKPSNVLVALYDDLPVVKVIDFGVAKATGGTLTEATLDTDFGVVVGTPLYMSPEQATLNNVDIDTRSDVYALGVLLYELLTGSPPFSKRELGRRGLMEILRVVREEEPPRPSTKLSTADALPSLSANRGTEPKKLTGLLRNELDWIVMKALEKDRRRRYESANGFAADVLRYLNGEAVMAHPPSTAYRFKKFVRRNKGQVIAASLILIALVAGVVGTTWGMVRARVQEIEARRQEGIAREQEAEARKQADLARTEADAKERARAEEARQRGMAESERKRADEEKLIAQTVNDFLRNKLLGQADSMAQADALLQEGGSAAEVKLNPTIRELLDRAARELAPDKIEANFPNQPLVQAANLQTIGTSYRGVGEAARAVEFLKRSEGLYRLHLGPEHPHTLRSINHLAMSYQSAGKIDLALPLYEETLRLRKATLENDHPITLTSINNLAEGYRIVGKLAKALPLHEESLRLHKARLGADHSHTLTSMNNLALTYQAAGKIDRALSLFEEALALTRVRLGNDHPHTLTSMNNLAACYQVAGKIHRALPLLEETLKLRRAKLGDDHPDTLTVMGNLAEGYREAGKFDWALPLFEETLKLSKVRLGTDHPRTISVIGNFAMTYRAVGRLDSAKPLAEEALAIAKRRLGADHPSTLTAMNHLASCYRADNKPDLALKLLEEALAVSKAKLGVDHPDTLAMMNNLASCYQDVRRVDLAVPMFEEVLRLRKTKLGADHPSTLTSLNNLAVGYRNAGRLDLALPMFEEVLRLRKAVLGPDHPDTLFSINNLASCYRVARKLDLAIPMLEEALKLRKAALGPDHPDTLVTMNSLASCYQDAGKLDLALAMFEQTLSLRRTRHGPDHVDTLLSVHNLAGCYWSLKQLDKSIPLFEDLLPRRQTKLGREHPDTLLTAGNLGVNYLGAGRLKEALPLLQEAYRSSKKHLVLRHFGPALLEAYRKTGDTAPYAALGKELLDDLRKTLPKESSQLASQLEGFGIGLLQLKPWAEAEPILRECLAMREKTQPDAWATFNTMSMLGGAL